MAIPFTRTVRSLESDRAGLVVVGLSSGAVLLAAWTSWFFLAKVPVYAVSETASLAAVREPHPVDAGVSGQVVAAGLTPGRQVLAGDVLVQLDDTPLRLELEGEQRRVESLARERSALGAELRTAHSAVAAASGAGRATVAEAQARYQEAQTSAGFALKQAERVAQLRPGGYVTEGENQRVQAEAAQRERAATALRLAVDRLQWEQHKELADRRARVQELESKEVNLAAQLDATNTRIARLQQQIGLRRVVAPIDGRLGQIRSVQPGTAVQEGQRLATVVPAGSVKIAADFTPSSAAGRIRTGQRAQVRLAALPWTQYGSIAAAVTHVSAEPSDGRLRVELAAHPRPQQVARLEHGMRGVAEVEVEQVAPAVLVLRAIGWLRDDANDR